MLIRALNRFLSFIAPKLGTPDVTLSSDQVSEFSWLAGGQFVVLLLSLVSIKLVTSIGPEAYGRFILATSIGGMLTLAFFGPLEQGYIRTYFDYTKDQVGRRIYFDSLIKVLSYSTVILAVAGTVFVLLGYRFYGFDPAFYVAAVFMIIIAVLNVPLNGMMNAMRLRKQSSIIQVIERIVGIAALAVAWWLEVLNATGVLLCFAFAGGLSLILRLWLYQSKASDKLNDNSLVDSARRKKIRNTIYRQIADYSQPFVLWGAIAWIQMNGERWVIDSVMTKTDVGKYGLASSLVNNSVVVTFGILTQFLTPIIFGKFASNDPETRQQGRGILRSYFWMTLVLFLGFATILFFAGEAIVHLLSSTEFTVDGLTLFLLTVGLGLFYTGQSLALAGMAVSKPRIYIPAKIISALLSVVFYYIGCKMAGVLGVVVAIVIVSILYMCLVYEANRRHGLT